MKSGSTKRIVVIKDIPSNFIEEAILILKGGPETDMGTAANMQKIPGYSGDFLLKEAEMVINNYIKESGARQASGTHSQPQAGKGRRKFVVNTVINTILLGSIALLIYLIVKIAQMPV